MRKVLTIATRNRHKTGEMAAIFGAGWTVTDLAGRTDLEEPEENGTTFEENAAIKAQAASQVIAGLILADDSGLEVDALGGAPGIRSARYAGHKASDAANRERLLAELAQVDGLDREAVTARFRCAVALAEGPRIVAAFSGAVEGRIVSAAAGSGGFGYDPVFIPDGYVQTFAELDAAIKNRISHRARAMAQVIDWLGRR
jgi:XTP/dITP diphosphohydrolase